MLLIGVNLLRNMVTCKSVHSNSKAPHCRNCFSINFMSKCMFRHIIFFMSNLFLGQRMVEAYLLFQSSTEKSIYSDSRSSDFPAGI